MFMRGVMLRLGLTELRALAAACLIPVQLERKEEKTLLLDLSPKEGVGRASAWSASRFPKFQEECIYSWRDPLRYHLGNRVFRVLGRPFLQEL